MNILKRLLGSGKWKNENRHAEPSQVQLVIGKTVIEIMLELIPKKGTKKATIPMTFEDNEFEIEVRMK